MHPTQSGLFLAVEGGDGAGKTTQIARLAARLTTAGRNVLTTREPGATPLGAHLRRLLLHPDTGPLDPRAEALLFAADRAQHAATVIRPHLNSGGVVITDRYMDSSAAYQGAGRALGHEEVLAVSRWATDDLMPDLTVLLDLDPAVGAARATTEEFGTPDRFETEQHAFLAAVRQGFLTIAATAPERYLVLDATAPADQISATIWAAVADRLPSN